MAVNWKSNWDTDNNFYNQIMASGQYWNDWDLQHAMEDPLFAGAIFNAKTDYDNATTDEAKALANAAAEQARAKYQYASGSHGDEYHPWGGDNAPAQAAPAAPTAQSFVTMQNDWTDRKNNAYDNVANAPSFEYKKFETPAPFEYEDFQSPDPFQYEPFQAPDKFTYDPFESQIEDYQHSDAYKDALANVQNYGPFEYDYTTDPLYAVYKKEYTREGQRAQADALAQAAAMTGGIPSSYATMAGQQANNYYASKIADKIPELRQQAYGEYRDNYNMLRDKYNAAAQGDQFDYGVWSDSKNREYQQYLDDLKMRYGIYSDEYQNAYKQWADKVNMDYGIYRDNYNDAYKQWADKVNLDYGIYNDNYDRAYNQWADQTNLDYKINQDNYGRLLDLYNIAGTEENNAWNRYVSERDYADALDAQEYQRRWAEAEAAAQMGDFSKYRELGINPDMASLLNYTLAANGRTTPVGGGGGYGGSGSGTPGNTGSGPVDLSTDIGKEVAAIPGAVGGYLDRWDDMDAETRYMALVESGVDTGVALRLSSSGDKYQAQQALIEALENPTNNEPVVYREDNEISPSGEQGALVSYSNGSEKTNEPMNARNFNDNMMYVQSLINQMEYDEAANKLTYLLSQNVSEDQRRQIMEYLNRMGMSIQE